MTTMRNMKQMRGFTLIEVMIVVVILGILAAVVVPNLMDKPDQAKITKTKHDIRELESALQLYRLDNHSYPSTDQGLEALTKKPANAGAWKDGGYIKSVPKDAWGREYQYLNPGVHGTIDVFSYGEDGQQGGDGMAGDIGNWNLDG